MEEKKLECNIDNELLNTAVVKVMPFSNQSTPDAKSSKCGIDASSSKRKMINVKKVNYHRNK